jgi:predicted small integral membrane protein
MIDLIQFPSPHVPIEDYSHIIVGDEVMVAEIIVESIVMMKSKKSPLPRVKMETNLVPKSFFLMVTVLWFMKTSVPMGSGFFPYIRSLA